MPKNENFNLNNMDFNEAINRFSKVNIKDFKVSNPLKNQIKVGSLFAGIGGIDLGFIKAGFHISWANEIDKDACITYKTNFGEKIICKDITKLTKKDISNIDILTGGFPCQAFSIAGYRQGFNDERGAIFFELMRLVKELKPKILFLENVKNLKTHNNGETFNLILKSIEKEGYFIKYQIINTYEFSDLPQNRERLYIVCFKNKQTYNNFEFPKKKKKTQSIIDILEKNVEDKFYYTQSKYYSILKQEITKNDTCYQWRRHYVRENKSNLCPTLTANMGTGGHNVPLVLDNKDIRKLTPKECARLQGFPDTFLFPKTLAISKIYKQIGNSVSVPIITQIAKKIMLAIKGK